MGRRPLYPWLIGKELEKQIAKKGAKILWIFALRPELSVAPLLFVHLFPTALEWNTAGVITPAPASTGLGHLELQPAGITCVQVPLFHVATICHFQSSFSFLIVRFKGTTLLYSSPHSIR